MSNRKHSATFGDFGLPMRGVIWNRDLNFVNARINQMQEPTVSAKYIINPRLTSGFKTSFGKSSKSKSTKLHKNAYNNNYGSNSMWYPNMFIDLNYNPDSGGYIDANGPNGPYFALGLGNYPRSMYKQLYFGVPKRTERTERPGSPEKFSFETYVLYESDSQQEEQDINNILNDPDTNIGDYIEYAPSNQLGMKTARIVRDRNGNKKLGPWKYYDELYFGKKTGRPGRPRKESPKRSPKIKYCLPKEQKFPVNTKRRCSAALSYARYAPDPCEIARCVQRNCKKYPTVGTHSKLIKECDAKKKRKPKKR